VKTGFAMVRQRVPMKALWKELQSVEMRAT
jgi:hypothetical protein